MGPGVMGCDGKCGSSKVVDCAGVRPACGAARKPACAALTQPALRAASRRAQVCGGTAVVDKARASQARRLETACTRRR